MEAGRGVAAGMRGRIAWAVPSCSAPSSTDAVAARLYPRWQTFPDHLMGARDTAPSITIDQGKAAGNGTRLQLKGRWTLRYAAELSAALADAPEQAEGVDATGVDRLDSAGVLQLLRFARRREMDFDTFDFRPAHHALVPASEVVAGD